MELEGCFPPLLRTVLCSDKCKDNLQLSVKLMQDKILMEKNQTDFTYCHKYT